MTTPPVIPIDLNLLQRAALAIVATRLEQYLRQRVPPGTFEALRPLLAELLGRTVPSSAELPPTRQAPIDFGWLQRAALAVFSGTLEAWLRARLRPLDFEALRPVLAELFGRPVPSPLPTPPPTLVR